jgi:hypothetical protein
MTDYELVKNKDYTAIFKKFRPLMMKYFQRMIKVSSCGYEDFDEFADDFYPEMVKAVDAVKLERIKDPDKYGLYQQLAFYLQNFTTRKISKHIRDKKFNSQIKEDYDAPYNDTANENIERMASFHMIYTKYLDANQREIVDEVLSGTPGYKIPGYYKIVKIFKEHLEET